MVFESGLESGSEAEPETDEERGLRWGPPSPATTTVTSTTTGMAAPASASALIPISAKAEAEGTKTPGPKPRLPSLAAEAAAQTPDPGPRSRSRQGVEGGGEGGTDPGSGSGPGPAAKRRRVDVANAALKRPFRSPLLLKRAGAGKSLEMSGSPLVSSASPSFGGDGGGSGGTGGVGTTPSRAGTGTVVQAGGGGGGGVEIGGRKKNLFSTPVRASASSVSSSLSSSHGRGRGRGRGNGHGKGTSPLVAASSSSSKESAAVFTERKGSNSTRNELREQLRKVKMRTTARLRELDDELGMVEQAAKIERESEAKQPGKVVDAELRELVNKWKQASRAAAEELFELIRRRVDGMGGGEAWRSTRTRAGRVRFDGFGEEEERMRKRLRENDEGNFEEVDEQEEERDPQTDEKDEAEGFTMLMMLKSLNIDPQLLGYDAEEDGWRD